jgi:methyltransferase
VTALYWIVAAVALQRLGEVVYARRNTVKLLARGGVEAGAGHYPLIVGLHGAWLLAILIVVPGDRPVDWAMLAIYGLLQVPRYWTLAALGPYWTTRVIVIAGAPTVRTGPYRFMRHPNYAVVVGEIAVLPLVFGAWPIALVFSVVNAAVLAHRVRIENAARRGNE